MPSFARYARARSLFHDRKTASIASRSCAPRVVGDVGDADDRAEARLEAARGSSRANASSPDARARPASVASFSPRSRIVSIIPGIDTGAPDRTLTSSGSDASPKRRPTRRLDPGHPRAQLLVEAVRPARRARNAPARLGRDRRSPGGTGRPSRRSSRRGSRPCRRRARARPRRGSSNGWSSGYVAPHDALASPAAPARPARARAAGRGSRRRSRRATAAATAGATRSSAPSLMPFAPYGPGPVGVLDDVALHPERQVHARSGSGSRWRRGSGSGPSSSRM